MSDSRLISVVIPNYNCGAFLKECLDSVISQSYRNLEIIVVDDGSTDNSLDVLSDYLGVICLTKTSNKGAASARNLGLSLAKGEFVAFLDSDDVWQPGKLELQINKIDDENCDIVYCSSREYFGGSKFGDLHLAKHEGHVYKFYRRYPARAIIVQGCSGALIRKSVFDLSGNFDETFTGAAEDWDFFRRCSRVVSIGFLPEALVYYRKHGSGIMARPTTDWYLGNSKAITKMFFEDPNIRYLERRWIWMKFQFSASKTFLKNCEIKSAILASLKALRGI
jgi:glycosyltransferase involved in cell wall biosynthesis